MNNIMNNPDYKALCAELVVIDDAMSGGSVQLSSQGQALDGYAALAAFRYIADKARIALSQPEPVALSSKEVEVQEAFTQLRDEILNLSDGLEVNEVLGIIDNHTPEWV